MRNVPADEAQEVRELLEQHEIEFFETSAGSWGVSMPALWLINEEQLQQAQQLLDEYQLMRSKRMQQEYVVNRQRGEAKSILYNFSEKPLRFVAYLGLIVIVLFISLQFFLSF